LVGSDDEVPLAAEEVAGGDWVLSTKAGAAVLLVVLFKPPVAFTFCAAICLMRWLM
jgi:hypothetical protein